MPRQGEGRVAAADQGRADGDPRQLPRERPRSFLPRRCARATWSASSATTLFQRTARFSKASPLSNELAITGESAPVLKQPGTDMFSTVTAGTLLVSDRLVVRVTADPGESFLDRMIHLVEGAKRQKTPNELALTALLAILTLIFLIVVSAMAPVAVYLQARINVADLVALLVALIPTTIGALLSAIGIAGIDRTFRFNMLAMSGKAVEAAGDVHTLLLDKTGTITVGDRQATEFLPLGGVYCQRTDSSGSSGLAASTRRPKDARSSRLANGLALPESRYRTGPARSTSRQRHG